jgi:SAM-dependent methyltransferase
MDGFINDPHSVYDYFVPLITLSGAVLDVGCGTGRLLRYLLSKAVVSIIPYGVDFRPRAIEEARRHSPRNHVEHFVCTDALSWSFDLPFAYVLIDPVIVRSRDRSSLLAKGVQHLAAKGTLLLYTYRDGLDAIQLKTLAELPGIPKEALTLLVHNESIEIYEYA